ncbi:LysR family transcriptional regulator [Neptuniibacter sp. QD57_21]|uniref:LysR family transcriptional regulator n=1 Tax=Neptuniibacter sp. QD57_21 TaxID=3398213 RepID=UPI0039F6332F
MDRLPPLKALRVFLVAAEHGSFKVAAEKLFVTQAAVSQQIRLLEEYFAKPLFIRLNREVRLSPAGAALLPYIQQAFKAIEEGSRALSVDPSPNQLKITSLPSFAARWLIPRLGSFQQAYPEFNCLVSTSCDLHDFSDDSQDLAIRFAEGGNTQLMEKILTEDYIVSVCHPDLLQTKDGADLNLGNLPLLIDDSPELKQVNAGFIREMGGNNQVVLQLLDSSLQVDAALNGQGVAPIRYSLVYEYIERGHLVCPLKCYWNSPYANYLVAPEANFDRPKVMAFTDWIMEEVRAVEAHWQVFKDTYNFSLIGD